MVKYRSIAAAMQAIRLPSAIETTGGMGKADRQLIREIHHSVGQGMRLSIGWRSEGRRG